MQAQKDLAMSQSLLQVAGAKERFTRSVANMGLETERNSQAIENRTDAVLNQVKTAKELEQMDLATVKEELAIAQMLREMSKGDEEDLEKHNIQTSEASVQTGQQVRPISSAEGGMEPE